MREHLKGKELELFNALSASEFVSVDDILAGRSTKSKRDRNSVVARIKYLAAKIAPHGYIIKKETKVGRGHKAVYSMKKYDFADERHD